MTPLADNEALSKFIYIAGPISNGSKLGAREILKNVQNGEDIFMELVKKGYNPICPHFTYYPWLRYEEDIKWQVWLTMDENYVKASPLLFYMKPEIYGDSKGALHEYELAKKLGKTIYTSLDQVPDLNKVEEVTA
jgi:hypothetical protein